MYQSRSFLPQLNISNILHKMSNGITTINKIIPVYEKVKPLISNVKKELTKLSPIEKNPPIKKDELKKSISVLSNPTFFQ